VHSSTLTEVLSAAHLSFYVESATKDRGGIMLVAPAGSLKSSISEIIDAYPKTLLLADLTIRQAAMLRSDMIASKLATLAFSDFAKLYQRNSSVASNIEGFIRGIVGEGYRNVNWEDARAVALPARCLVVGSMTSDFYNQHFPAWLGDGIARRFLWVHFQMARQADTAVNEAIRQGKRLHLAGEQGLDPSIPTEMLPENVTDAESKRLVFMLKDQPDMKIPMVLLRRILTALKWKHRKQPKKPMQIMEEFATSLSKNGCELFLPEIRLS
jgi:hypothetical protein